MVSEHREARVKSGTSLVQAIQTVYKNGPSLRTLSLATISPSGWPGNVQYNLAYCAVFENTHGRGSMYHFGSILTLSP